MKYFLQLSFLLLLLLSWQISIAQFALNGTVDINPYEGLQPDLIRGVSALPATGQPVLRHVYLVDRNILALTIDERAIIISNFKPYEEEETDTIMMSGYHGLTKLLVRKGEPIGFLCGMKNDWYRPFSVIAGQKLDVAWASRPSTYTLIDGNSRAFKPSSVYRKTYLSGKKITSLKDAYTLRHELFLKFDDDLAMGEDYTLDFSTGGPFSAPVRFACDERLRSEAIHINMAGYAPSDLKVAFLSMWMGDGGGHAYAENLPFKIVDTETGATVFTSASGLRKAGNVPEYTIGDRPFNHNLADIHALDFSGLRSPGNYRLVVPGIGSSFEFEIDDQVWERTARLLMKGFLHQRSGIELGPPYTDYQRPRNMHTHDDFVVYQCDVDKFFNPTSEGVDAQRGVFERIKASIRMDTKVMEAWGGWMDAGDFDQRMSHLYSVRRMLYLHELNPEFFESWNLIIPESTNAIPDILDEGAWCLDLYRRTQGVYDVGGISWWVESIQHPREGESSWLNSLPTALVPPTPRACFHYAATAAQMALAVRRYDPTLSREYLESALGAMKWAQEHPHAPDPFGANARPVIEALAYVNLYRTTGDEKWHGQFIDQMKALFPDGVVHDAGIAYGELYAAYALIEDLPIDLQLMDDCRSALLALADGLIEGAEQTAYDIPRMPEEEMVRMVTLSRKILPIVMAHHISKNSTYKNALIKAMQYTMGANPMNRTYISGLGERCFTPYQHDWEADNLHIPAGLPNFGPAIQTEDRWGWRDKRFIDRVQEAGLYPNKLIEWPFVEKCFNNIWEAPTNEFTVRSPMGELLLLTGYLAQEHQ